MSGRANVPPPEPPGVPSDTPDAAETSTAGGGSAAATREPQHPTYDQAELARSLPLAFSPGELAHLARSFEAAPAEAAAGSPASGHETARVLVRVLAARGELHALVTRLRSEKPLVEWPSPLSYPDAATGPVQEKRAPKPASQSHPDDVEMPPPTEASSPTRRALQSRDSPPLPVRSPASGPLAIGDDDESGRGRWYLLAGVAAIAILGAVAAAFLAGRASTGSETAAGAAPEPRVARLAAPASQELLRSVQAVARACALPDDSGAPTDVLARAFRSCAERGRAVSRPTSPLLAPSTPTPTASVTAGPEPPRPPARRADQPARPGASCLDRCRRQHEQCKASECGPEPKLGSQYADYQRCLAGCLRKASQCRMRCG